MKNMFILIVIALLPVVANAAYEIGDAVNVFSLLKLKAKEADFCAKGTSKKVTIRSESGKYCDPSKFTAALAMGVCHDFTDPDGKPFAQTDCGKKLIDKIPNYKAALNRIVSKLNTSGSKQVCSAIGEFFPKPVVDNCIFLVGTPMPSTLGPNPTPQALGSYCRNTLPKNLASFKAAIPDAKIDDELRNKIFNWEGQTWSIPKGAWGAIMNKIRDKDYTVELRYDDATNVNNIFKCRLELFYKDRFEKYYTFSENVPLQLMRPE